MNNKILYELFVLGFAFMLAGAFSYDFSKPITGLATTGNAPIGYLDIASCDAIEGWAFDPDTPGAAIAVHLYNDSPAGSGPLLNFTVTGMNREDVYNAYYNTYPSVSHNTGFRLTTPTRLKDGRTHTIYAYGIDTNTNLGGPALGGSGWPKNFTCLAASGGGASRLVADCTYGTFDINTNNQDAAYYLKYPDGTTHGWRQTRTFPSMPLGHYSFSSLDDVSGFTKTASPAEFTLGCSKQAVTITYSPNVAPVGYLDKADCDFIFGWAADPNTPERNIAVHFYSDPPIGSGNPFDSKVTSENREDVYNAYKGAYPTVSHNTGFRIPTPAALKTGTHRISVYGIDTTTNTGGPAIGNSGTDATTIKNCQAASVCNPATQPSPHWGVKNGQCLRSCGQLGGTQCSSSSSCPSGDQSAGNSYDCNSCCVNIQCTYTLSSTSVSLDSAGVSKTASLTAVSGCAWTAASNAPWITITGGSSGTGNGQVTYYVNVNTGATRTSSLTIAGRTLTVMQSGPGGGGGSGTGTVIVDVKPDTDAFSKDGTGAAYYITKPDGTSPVWNGDHTFSNMPAGQYLIDQNRYQAYSGYTRSLSSDPSSGILAAGGTLRFTITYVDPCSGVTCTDHYGCISSTVSRHVAGGCSGGGCLFTDTTCPSGCGSDGQCVSSSGSNTQTLALKTGWNLISTYILGSTPLNQFASTCTYSGGPWRYSNSNGNYAAASAITNSRDGYWIKVANDCTVTLTGDKLRIDAYGTTLYNGWNLVGGIPETRPFADIKGTCTFSKGPYWWNTAADNYETPANMEPGKGYWIKVDNQCTMRAGQAGPPTAPQ